MDINASLQSESCGTPAPASLPPSLEPDPATGDTLQGLIADRKKLKGAYKKRFETHFKIAELPFNGKKGDLANAVIALRRGVHGQALEDLVDETDRLVRRWAADETARALLRRRWNVIVKARESGLIGEDDVLPSRQSSASSEQKKNRAWKWKPYSHSNPLAVNEKGHSLRDVMERASADYRGKTSYMQALANHPTIQELEGIEPGNMPYTLVSLVRGQNLNDTETNAFRSTLVRYLQSINGREGFEKAVEAAWNATRKHYIDSKYYLNHRYSNDPAVRDAFIEKKRARDARHAQKKQASRQGKEAIDQGGIGSYNADPPSSLSDPNDIEGGSSVNHFLADDDRDNRGSPSSNDDLQSFHSYASEAPEDSVHPTGNHTDVQDSQNIHSSLPPCIDGSYRQTPSRSEEYPAHNHNFRNDNDMEYTMSQPYYYTAPHTQFADWDFGEIYPQSSLSDTHKDQTLPPFIAAGSSSHAPHGMPSATTMSSQHDQNLISNPANYANDRWTAPSYSSDDTEWYAQLSPLSPPPVTRWDNFGGAFFHDKP